MSASARDVVALLRERKRQPDDIVPCRLLADWLDDFGGPNERALAELIRHDCALEAYPEGDAARRALIRDAWPPPALRRHPWRVWRGLFRVGYEASDHSDAPVEGPSLPGGWEWAERVSVRGVKG